MSFFVFALIFAFVLWQRLGKSRRPAKDVRRDVRKPASPLAAATDDDQVEDVAANVAGLVSDFLGQKGQELVGRAVSQVILEATQGQTAARRPAGPRQQSQKAAPSTKAASQPRDKRRVKYLLDGDGGFRQRTDRTARLQQSFRGKGLCSPR